MFRYRFDDSTGTNRFTEADLRLGTGERAHDLIRRDQDLGIVDTHVDRKQRLQRTARHVRPTLRRSQRRRALRARTARLRIVRASGWASPSISRSNEPRIDGRWPTRSPACWEGEAVSIP